MTERVKIYLLDKTNKVQYGLNWGQRENREHNQTYLQMTPEVYHSTFFPVKKHYFLVDTDDNTSFVMTRGQKEKDGSALETPEDNSLLGKYLRSRLGLPDGAKIKESDIEAYGRSDIDFIKIGENHYKMNFSPRIEKIPSQTIYYGVPGCGKSHCIEEETKDYPNELKPRVVFHPEYTNADFIGQILPIVKDIPDDSGAIQESKIGYDFIPGPFTSILLKACANLNRSYCLIIEEINRGNAAAIFGDIFQLLDRGDDGWSKYSVINRDILNYLKKLSKETEQYYADILTPQEASSVLKLLESGLKLPPNLSILATMNTSDQNVFTLDNAFQRRFGMKLIKNEFEDNKESQTQKNALIDGAKISEGPSDISWFKFQTEINKKISEVSRERGLSSMEDKRLGCWFVKNNEGKISAEDFVNKILKYLWDDAFKFDREAIFAKSYDSLETMISDYSEKGFDIFESNFKTALIPPRNC